MKIYDTYMKEALNDFFRAHFDIQDVHDVELATMAFLAGAEALYLDGYGRGHEDGYNEGYDEGYCDGFEEAND